MAPLPFAARKYDRASCSRSTHCIMASLLSAASANSRNGLKVVMVKCARPGSPGRSPSPGWPVWSGKEKGGKRKKKGRKKKERKRKKNEGKRRKQEGKGREGKGKEKRRKRKEKGKKKGERK